ncbi:uncharacterized protein LOC116964653 [Tyto alba]|uniref:uncharacterized protein LOC116964653 n=1 Tax=Tyto alba TaxID=56313 RepID=UPI001C6730FE|nr:uncharacterized protein LOC116964653 [Tyto alba]
MSCGSCCFSPGVSQQFLPGPFPAGSSLASCGKADKIPSPGTAPPRLGPAPVLRGDTWPLEQLHRTFTVRTRDASLTCDSQGPTCCGRSMNITARAATDSLPHLVPSPSLIIILLWLMHRAKSQQLPILQRRAAKQLHRNETSSLGAFLSPMSSSHIPRGIGTRRSEQLVPTPDLQRLSVQSETGVHKYQTWGCPPGSLAGKGVTTHYCCREQWGSRHREKCSFIGRTTQDWVKHFPSASHTGALKPPNTASGHARPQSWHSPFVALACMELSRLGSPGSVPARRQLQHGAVAGQPGLISKANGLKNVTSYRQGFV